ncbi:hypothetical protein KIPB_008999, partial [Kipferlia bialata]
SEEWKAASAKLKQREHDRTGSRQVSKYRADTASLVMELHTSVARVLTLIVYAGDNVKLTRSKSKRSHSERERERESHGEGDSLFDVIHRQASRAVGTVCGEVIAYEQSILSDAELLFSLVDTREYGTYLLKYLYPKALPSEGFDHLTKKVDDRERPGDGGKGQEEMGLGRGGQASKAITFAVTVFVTALVCMSAFAGAYGVTNQANLIASMPSMYAGVVGALLIALNQAGKSTGIAAAVLLQKLYITRISGWEGPIPSGAPTPEYLPYYTDSTAFVACCAVGFALVAIALIPGIGYSENDRGKKYCKEHLVETVTCEASISEESRLLTAEEV